MEVNSHPVVTINNHTYKGDMDGEDIAMAVCASFKDRPKYCSRQQFFNQSLMSDFKGLAVADDSVTPAMWVFAIFFILFINFGMLYIHRMTSNK